MKKLRTEATCAAAAFALFAAGCAGEREGASSRGPGPITEVTFDPVVLRYGHGDNWCTTWSDDDHQYTSCDDGRGWGAQYFNNRVWRLVGPAEGFTAENLAGYPAYDGSKYAWYGFGIVSVDGTLYHFITYQRRSPVWGFEGARLIYSTDHGGTWRRHDGVDADVDKYVHDASTMFFWEPDGWPFSLISFLQYGRDNSLAKDGYVYLYSPNGCADLEHLLLARVPKDRILERSAYEFFVSLDGNGAPVWSSDIAQRGTVHTFPSGWVDPNRAYAWHAHVVYDPGIDLYLMVAAGTGRDGSALHSQAACLSVCSSAQPWGPWEEIHFDESWVADDPGNRLYEPVIPPKWISADGKTFWLVFSDARDGHSTNYKFNMQKVTLTVQPPTAPAIAQEPEDASATENETVSFSVVASGWPTPTYQWKRDGQDVDGATSATYSFKCTLADDGAKFSVVVTNSEGAVTSREALLTVTADTAGPRLVSVTAVLTTEVHAVFDEALDASTTNAASNYAVAGGAGQSVTSAELQADGETVKLTTSPGLEEGVDYTLTVTGVTDEAGNDLQAAYSQKTFRYAGGLVGWWKLDDASGSTATDSSAKGNHGTVHGATWTAGIVGGCLSFEGTEGSYVEIPNEADYDLKDAVSYAVWIKASPGYSNDWLGVITKGDHMNLQSQGTSEYLVWQTRDSPGTISQYQLEETAGTIDGSWHHVACTFDGAKKCIYVDGELNNSADAVGYINTTDYPIMIGKNGEEAGHAFGGLIDDVRVYARAINADEVRALYEAGSGGPDKDGDGLPDAWETQYGLDPNEQDTDGDGTPDPDEDLDGDGFTNLDEYRNGTDPTSHLPPPATGRDGCAANGGRRSVRPQGATCGRASGRAVALLLAALCAWFVRKPLTG